MKVIKKLSLIILSIAFCIILTGCGDKNKDPNIDDIINGSEKQNDEKNNTENESTSGEEVKLYSDDTKIVFNVGDVYHVVFNHDGENIIGMEYVYSYPDADSAKYAETMLKVTYEEGNGVKSVSRTGKQIKIVFDENTYHGLTVEQVRTDYSMYEEMYNN